VATTSPAVGLKVLWLFSSQSENLEQDWNRADTRHGHGVETPEIANDQNKFVVSVSGAALIYASTPAVRVLPGRRTGRSYLAVF